jgi:hypothetical protein
MLAWRCVIIVVSLSQIATGVVCWYVAAGDPEIGDLARFGLATCLTVGGLGLLCQGTTFLRPAAFGANALLAVVFVPGFLGRLVVRILLLVDPGLAPPGTYPGYDADLFAAGMLFGGAASAYGLWLLSAGPGTSPSPPDAVADRPLA